MKIMFPIHTPGIHTTRPPHTQRNKHVIITSKRRFDVIIMCLLRFVYAGRVSGIFGWPYFTSFCYISYEMSPAR